MDLVQVFWPGADRQAKAEKQIRWVLDSRRRYQALFGGRGAGKTWCLALKALVLALQNPGVRGALYGRTKTEALNRLLPVLLAHLRTFEESTGVDLVHAYNRGAGTITLLNGSVIELNGYNARDKNRGPSVGWACVDEIEFGELDARDAFQSITEVVREPCPLPCVAVVSSPNGATGLAGLFYSRLQDPELASDYFVIRATADSNPGIDPAYLKALKQGSSKRSWLQEGMGEILTAEGLVFSEYNDTRHRLRWAWDRSLPYLLGIDWGTSRAAAVVVQVQPDGTWIVVDELLGKEISYGQFRQQLMDYAKRRGPPAVVAADRAVKSENSWARQAFGPKTLVSTCDSKKDQQIITGIEMIRTMLDPADGVARLMFASSLAFDPSATEGGIVGSLMNYGYKVGRNGVITNLPDDSPVNPWKHAIDALRYLVVTTAKDPRWHGGRPLPFSGISQPIDYASAYA